MICAVAGEWSRIDLSEPSRNVEIILMKSVITLGQSVQDRGTRNCGSTVLADCWSKRINRVAKSQNCLMLPSVVSHNSCTDLKK